MRCAEQNGWVAEWFKAAVLKTAVGASPPWVRIPPHPPATPLWFVATVHQEPQKSDVSAIYQSAVQGGGYARACRARELVEERQAWSAVAQHAQGARLPRDRRQPRRRDRDL